MLDHLSISDTGDVVTVTWRDGLTSRFHAQWLRDNAPDAHTRDPGNGQKLITQLDLPEHCTLSHATVTPRGELEAHFLPESISATYRGDWLREHRYDRPAPRQTGWVNTTVERWDSKLQSSIPQADFTDLQSDPDRLRDWLAAVTRYGFAKLTQVPVENGSLMEVVDLFGYVRETNYGRYFDVRSETNPINLAFTGLGLSAHTDNPYRDPVPTLQLLVCLENSTAGGESIVVDGFRAVEILAQESPEHFALLSGYCANYEFRGSDNVCLRVRKPMIELGPDGELLAVRFNNRSIAALDSIPFERMPDYYAAYRHLTAIIHREDLEICFKLEPGELFIVDNTRVLHARKQFSGSGTRWLQGCYADKDSLRSRLAVLEQATS